MLFETILKNYIDIKTSEYVTYNTMKEYDNTLVMVFHYSNNPKDNKVINGKVRTPNCLRMFIGQKVIIYNDYLNSTNNEIFRLKLSKHIINHNPYFTSTSLVLPLYYINKYLDDQASILRVSLVKTEIDKGNILIEFVLNKTGEIWNYPLYRTPSGLKTKTMLRFLNMIDESGKRLEEFHYVDSIDVSFNKYKMMIFRE